MNTKWKSIMQGMRSDMEESFQLMERKSADYSRDNIEATGVSGVSARIMDKASRLVNLTNQAGTPNFESIEDTFRDLINYGLIGLSVANGSWNRSTDTVYLGGAIDGISKDAATGWRAQAQKYLTDRHITCFNPASAFGVPLQHANAEYVRIINRVAIDSSSVVLINLLNGGFGSIREIEYAKATGKRVIVVHKDLTANLEAYDLEVCSTLEDALYRIVPSE